LCAFSISADLPLDRAALNDLTASLKTLLVFEFLVAALLLTFTRFFADLIIGILILKNYELLIYLRQSKIIP
jgi:hypothetical protein